MAACEWCWREAGLRGTLLGGGTYLHYSAVIREQDDLGDKAGCPEARANYVKRNQPTR